MNDRWAALALLLSAACDGASGADAGPPLGTWRLTSQTVGATETSGDSLDGHLTVTANTYAAATVRPTVSGQIDSFVMSGDGKAMTLGDGTMLPFHVASGKLTIEADSQRKLVYEMASDARVEQFAVAGTVSLADGAAAMTAPRAALIFLSRSEPPFVNDPRDDQTLTFSASKATFDVSRTDSARGTDRITFGQKAGISIAIVVVYDDRDHSGSLDDPFQPCSSTTKDCVRGVSTLVLGYRDGDSAELAASPYAFLRPGWSSSVKAPDNRTAAHRLGLVSTDGQRSETFDVTVPADTSQVMVPSFDLGP